MSACHGENTSTPFSPSGIPTTGDGAANVAEAPPTGSVARPDMGTTRPDAGVTDASVGDMAVQADMTSEMVTTPDLATTDLAHNPAGPWPVTDVITYAIADLIDSSPDEAQNIWAASEDTLYLLRPGASSFQKFTEADGLHIQPFTDPWGNPAVTHITAISGGVPNEIFVGYYGYESDSTRDRDPDSLSSLGWADRVELGAGGKLTAVHYWFHCDRSPGIVEDRSVRRMTYVHDGTARGHLFLGMDHGVVHIFDDMAGDHVHPEVNYQKPDGTTELKIGENYGLFVKSNGDVWIAGGYGVGLQPFNPTPHFDWVDASFKDAFTVYTSDHGFNVPYGYREDQRGVGVTSDGMVWFASKTHGLWSYDGTPHNYTSSKAWPAAPTDLMDLAVDLDDTLWLVTSAGQLLRFDPKTNGYSVFPGLNGVRRVVLDTTVVPRALYVSGSSGLTVIRAK
jgi:hypothetical protein